MRPGQLVADRYRLLEQVGAGGGGTVWLANDELLGRDVAIKRALPAEGARGAKHIRGLRREAELLAKLNHPHVVTLFDVVQENGEWWMVMEYVPSRSLADQETLPAERVARLGVQIADALEAVHAAGIVHGDIKPGNVFVTDDGRAKLGDFGISRSMYADVTVSESGAVIAGTPAYISPEVAKGREPTPASDVFSLGATLFAAADALVIDAPADGPEPSPPRRRAVLRAAAVVCAITVIAVVAWVVVGPPSPTPRPAAPASALGDPHKVDPCALHDTAQLARFGTTEIDTAYGNFNRCDVLVNPRSGGEVDVKAELINPDPAMELPRKVENLAGIQGWRELQEEHACSWMLLLRDKHLVNISADSGDASVNMCAIADTAVKSAATVLSKGQLPPRKARPVGESLFWANACALLDAKALSRLPGVDSTHPRTEFGNWECRWDSTTSHQTLIVRFDQDDPLNAQDGRPIRLGGHDAFVDPEYDSDTCAAQVVHRRAWQEDGVAAGHRPGRSGRGAALPARHRHRRIRRRQAVQRRLTGPRPPAAGGASRGRGQVRIIRVSRGSLSRRRPMASASSGATDRT